MKRKHIGKIFIASVLAAAVLTGCSGSAGTSGGTEVSTTVGGLFAHGSSSSETSATSSAAFSSSISSSSTKSSSAPQSSAPASSVTESSAPQSTAPQSTAALSSTQQSSSQSSSQTESEPPQVVSGNTPYEKHGALSVNGAYLVDSHGQKTQLRGMSTHGLAWFPQYVNYDTFKFLRDDWNTNCIRLAMYTYESGGYCTDGNKDELKNLVKSGVEYATQLGMYVIIDWHVLNEQNPLTYKEEAKKFFDEMSRQYANYGNVIYEICNEPNNSGSWWDVKTYANEVIPVIRANSPNSVILVGTPTWSQDIDQAAASPLDFNNIMYTLHFYAATHTDWLRSRMENCINSGLPVFVSEFGTCDASGNGAVDEWQSNEWRKLIEKYNTSYMCWNLANKNESSSIINSGCDKLYGWTDSDLSTQGKWIRNWFVSESD